jgi:hypothetical protein
LAGPTGVGKSFAAVATLRKVSNAETPVDSRRFFYFPELCGRLLDPGRRQNALTRAKTTEFVVFDDFGVEYVKEGGLVDAFLDEIIWTRESMILPTIITTNLDVEALKARLPERLIDRLRGEWGSVFECPGESLRRERRSLNDTALSWGLMAAGENADVAVSCAALDELTRLLDDEVGEPAGTDLRRRWAEEWRRERRTSSTSDGPTLHAPASGDEAEG